MLAAGFALLLICSSASARADVAVPHLLQRQEFDEVRARLLHAGRTSLSGHVHHQIQKRRDLHLSGPSVESDRVAILNDVPFHLEVLAGVIYCLHRKFKDRMDLYLYPNIYKFTRIGLSRWIGVKHSTLSDARQPPGRTAQVLIIISPEYNMQTNQRYIAELKVRRGVYKWMNLKPRVVIAFIHNAKTANLAALLALHPAICLVTLAPHTAAFVQRRLQESGISHPVEWLLPVHPYEPPSEDCVNMAMVTAGATAANSFSRDIGNAVPGQAPQLHDCLKGFCIQGIIDPARRNYTALLSQIAARRAEGAPSVVSLDLVGKMGRKGFVVPPQLADIVRMRIKVPYLELYGIIHHSWALLPMLATEDYFISKFSSTVISSLVTGVPMMATPRLLLTYSFLDPGLVFLYQPLVSEERLTDAGIQEAEKLVGRGGGQAEGAGFLLGGTPSSLVDAMVAVTELPVAEGLRRRERLVTLRDQLNEQALNTFIRLMAQNT